MSILHAIKRFPIKINFAFPNKRKRAIGEQARTQDNIYEVKCTQSAR